MKCAKCQSAFSLENKPKILCFCGHSVCAGCVRGFLASAEDVLRCPFDSLAYPRSTKFEDNLYLLAELQKPPTQKEMPSGLGVSSQSSLRQRQNSRGSISLFGVPSNPVRTSLVDDEQKVRLSQDFARNATRALELQKILHGLGTCFKKEAAKVRDAKLAALNRRFDEISKGLETTRSRLGTEIQQHFHSLCACYDVLRSRLKEADALLELEVKNSASRGSSGLPKPMVDVVLDSIDKFLSENPEFREPKLLLEFPKVVFNEQLIDGLQNSLCQLRSHVVRPSLRGSCPSNVDTILSEEENLLVDSDENRRNLQREQSPNHSFLKDLPAKRSAHGSTHWPDPLPEKQGTARANTHDRPPKQGEEFRKLASSVPRFADDFNKNSASEKVVITPFGFGGLASVVGSPQHPFSPAKKLSILTPNKNLTNILKKSFFVSPELSQSAAPLPTSERRVQNGASKPNLRLDSAKIQKFQQKLENSAKHSQKNFSRGKLIYRSNQQKALDAVNICIIQKSRVLDLSKIDLTDKLLSEIVAPNVPKLGQLQTVSLNNNRITEVGIKILLGALRESEVECILAQQNDIRDVALESVLMFRKSNHTLKFVDFSHNGISQASNKVRNLVGTLQLIGTKTII